MDSNNNYQTSNILKKLKQNKSCDVMFLLENVIFNEGVLGVIENDSTVELGDLFGDFYVESEEEDVTSCDRFSVVSFKDYHEAEKNIKKFIWKIESVSDSKDDIYYITHDNFKEKYYLCVDKENKLQMSNKNKGLWNIIQVGNFFEIQEITSEMNLTVHCDKNKVKNYNEAFVTAPGMSGNLWDIIEPKDLNTKIKYLIKKVSTLKGEVVMPVQAVQTVDDSYEDENSIGFGLFD